jgi:two-component system competent response regulator ComA
MTIRIVLVDNSPTQELTALFEKEIDLKVIAAYPTGKMTEIAKNQSFDVLFLKDIEGVEMAKQISRNVPDIAIVVCTGSDLQLDQMMQSGISGYVPQSGSAEQMIAAIRCAHRGEVILPLSLVRQLRIKSTSARN